MASGRAYCHGIAKEGGAVVVADINGAAAEGVVKAITDSGGKALSVQVDVAIQQAAWRWQNSAGQIR
jgi:meso-butanediol dehydrogenase/(S,S)-butanediol dehydrogenase/diacetyl reductase